MWLGVFDLIFVRILIFSGISIFRYSDKWIFTIVGILM